MKGPLGENSLDLPFEKVPTGQTVDASDALIASGLVVLAVVVPVPEVGPMPGLMFRFANPDGSGFFPPMILCVDEDQMVKTAAMVSKATAAAIGAAS